MTYATRRDLEDRFGAQEVEDLLAAPRAIDAGSDAVPDDPAAAADARLDAALADAAAEIDAALAVVYALPLPAGSYPVLTAIACDLARDELYDDAPLDEPKARREAAMKQLEGLRDGKLNLVDDAGNIVARRNVAARAGPAPVMTRENLAGLL